MSKKPNKTIRPKIKRQTLRELEKSNKKSSQKKMNPLYKPEIPKENNNNRRKNPHLKLNRNPTKFLNQPLKMTFSNLLKKLKKLK